MHGKPRGGAMPEVGGIIIKFGDNGPFAKPWVRRIERPAEVIA
jgi:hypothetical protein